MSVLNWEATMNCVELPGPSKVHPGAPRRGLAAEGVCQQFAGSALSVPLVASLVGNSGDSAPRRDGNLLWLCSVKVKATCCLFGVASDVVTPLPLHQISVSPASLSEQED